MPTHKISVKFYLDQGHNIAPDTWFKTFNNWISAHNGADVLLDVADYSHVPNGPCHPAPRSRIRPQHRRHGRKTRPALQPQAAQRR